MTENIKQDILKIQYIGSFLSDSNRTYLQFFLPLILLCGIPVMCFPNLFNYINEDYYFYISALLFLFIACYSLFNQKIINIKVSKIDIVVSLFFLYIIINSIIFRDSFHAINFISFVFFIIIYIITRGIYSIENKLQFFSNSVLLIASIEIIGALLQNFNVLPNLQPNMPFGGSFANPGPFAIFLASVVPLVVHSILFYNNSKLLLFAKYLFITLVLYLLFLSRIRSSWITLVVGTGFVLAYKYQVIKRIKSLKPSMIIAISIVLIVLLSLTSYFMFNMKRNSAIGRLFIWENSVRIIQDNPVVGTGFGNFVYNYNIQQAKIVQSGQLTEEEYLQADDIKMAFNDFLQIGVEFGVIGLVFFLLIVFFCFHTVVKYKGKNKNELIVVFGVIIAMLTAGLTSYPLTILKNQLLLLFCVAFLSTFSQTHIQRTITLKKNFAILFKYLFFFLFLFGFFFTIRQHILLHKWEKAVNLYLNGEQQTAINLLNDIYPSLEYNKQFVYNYASVQISNNENYKVNLLFNNLYKNGYYNDYSFHMLIGNFNMSISNFFQAENSYKKALEIIPSKFTPKYNLLICKLKTGNKSEAYKIAQEIIDSPIKIYSPEIERIQASAKQVLNIK